MIAGLGIRAEREADQDAIRAVHDAAFGQPDEGRIVDLQREDPRHDAGLSIVAELDGVIVGHVLLSWCALEGPGDGAAEGADADAAAAAVLALGPIAVSPAHQRHGVGERLMETALEVARSRGAPALVLLGHPTYYPRFGFEPARPLGLLPPAAWPDPAWMARRLPGWTPALKGIVRYPASFSPL